MQPRFHKKTTSFLIFLIINQLVFPSISLALTSGPTQPELQSFQAAGTTEMVDLFSGDFNYNIPLFELPGPDGGYPINLFYNSVTSPEQEASFVGLGWNIGVGSITRQMRGLPDDFNGEQIKRRMDMKPNWTMGLSEGLNLEVVGSEPGANAVFSLGGSLEFSIMYNSYRGLGVSCHPEIHASMGYGPAKIGGGFGVTINSLEGSTANLNFAASLNVSGENEKNKTRSGGFGFNAGLDFDSKEGGLSNVSLGINIQGTAAKFSQSSFNAMLSNLTFVQTAYTPAITMPMGGENVAVGVSVGVPLLPVGLNIEGNMRGFFSSRHLIDKNVVVSAPAHGAMYHQNATSNSLQDVNRENDGAVRFQQPNLAVPSFTSDVLSVTGQGVGGSYQLYRSDIPFLSDRAMYEFSGGGALDIEIGSVGYNTRAGASINLNSAVSATLRPMNHLGNRKAYHKAPNSDFQPYYYKLAGEATTEESSSNIYEYMGGDKPVKLDLTGAEALEFGTQLRTTTGQTLPDVKGRTARKPKSTSIQPITNKELKKSTSNDTLVILPEYKIKYFDRTSQPSTITSYSTSKTALTRPNGDQIAGYTVVGQGASRWNFALPVINKKQIDACFSVDNPASACSRRVPIELDDNNDIDHKVPTTDNFLDITEIPAYAHSYLLTSVVGSDYVDMDITDGEPNEKDLGYWIKIEYNKTSNTYKWRTPFAGATYIRGLSNKDTDDKASFNYGEREQFYPARIISKTHVGEFYYSQRNDGRGANTMLQNDADTYRFGDHSYKLDSISIFTQKEKELAALESRSPIALKTVHFKYNNSFCKNVENNAVSGNGSGKLMLERVYFTHENNRRGELSPYKFQYNNNDSTVTYNEFMFDRWGVYKPITGGDCQNVYNPFVTQNVSDSVMAITARVWHLTDIFLPSGAKIKIDIGRDHYSHEQDKVAGQLFQLKGVESYGDSTITTDENPDASELKIFFDLEGDGIATSATTQEKQQEIERYFTDLYRDEYGLQLFFQLNVDLLKKTLPHRYQDITGYASIDTFGIDGYNTGGYYKRGYIRLKQFPIPLKHDYYHPFAATSWQFIKQNLTEMMYGQSFGTTPTNDDEKGQAVRGLVAAFSSLGGLFKDYYRVCSNRSYGSILHLDRCFIRLNTPDRKMYGDGVRVKRVLLYDNWGEEETPVYGTVYDYDEEELDPLTNEPTGRMVSSGTASSTPIVGKQESSLRYVKSYIEDLKYRQDILHTTEYPLNEAYYPGAGVGYRKVTVKSLATDYALKKLNSQTLPSELPSDLPAGFATSGVTINEFYTYKDFPIITRETPIVSNTNGQKFSGGFFGSSFTNICASSQGYSIELPNMHGRPFRVSNYGQDKLGNILTEPISWVQYDYKYTTEIYTEGTQQRFRKILNNFVDVVVAEQDPTDATKALIKQNVEIGVDREFFIDVRENTSLSTAVTASVNVDIVTIFFGIPIPIPFALPIQQSSEETLRTAVTNKIIRRSGVLTKTTAYDGQSQVTTENKLFDKYTGQALLTTVNNNYDDLIYSYTIPGHFAYDRMGAAYENWGLTFTGDVDTASCNYYALTSVDTMIAKKLIVGDEYIVTNNSTYKSRATLIDKSPNSGLTGYNLKLAFETIPSSLPVSDLNFMIVRSGNRNHLTASVGNITALSNPTVNRSKDTCYAYVYGTTSSTQTACTTPVWADELVNLLNTYVQKKDSLLSCDTSLIYRFKGVGRACVVPSFDAAWSSFATAMEGCTNPACIAVPDDVHYIDNIKLFNSSNASLFNLLSIHHAYNINSPTTTITANDINDLLNDSLANNKIPYHSLYYDGCSISGGTTYLEILVSVPKPNGYSDQYVLVIDTVACASIVGGTTTISVYSPDSTNIDTIPIAYRSLDNVLSISAATYKDNWDLITPPCSSSTVQTGVNMFQNGMRGIFRQHQTWTYVANRNQSNPINLRVDGDMDNVVIFDWKNPFTQLCAAFDKWKKTTTVTQYSGGNGEAVESKNIIDQYSAALYGYKGTLPIAVAANANLHEIGFEGFEEYPTVTSTSYSNVGISEPGNIRFVYQACSSIVTKHYDLQSLVNSSSANIILNTSFSNFATAIPQKVVIALANGLGTSYSFESVVSSISQYSVGGNTYPQLNLSTNISCALPSGLSAFSLRFYTGNATLYYTNGSTGDPSFGIVDSVSHTGNKSLRVPSNNNYYLPQADLNLVANKQYVLSAWVYTGNLNKHTYENDVALVIDLFSNNFKPSGPVIDGWQRIEGIFTCVHTSPALIISNKTNGNIFLDDIRIFPKNSNIQTYVYDPVTYRVTEILDNNNYFARYKYDQQGSPISVQKETERGIKTIQETGSFTKDARNN